ncbi:hypothetical protein [Mycolicibacterium fortuitum]|uniref:hypothetical protein n=1 Tax=Mycolicibacterium fortuitum TaxID=1766 RepID=UPI0024201CAC|nr:hypothetical protein [Mycolicibacterium fortuitum]MDG5785848.1 hypothetical protein [Mycolicibacterium fortuitum]
MRLRIVTGIVVAGVVLSGCSNVTAGTPMADPDQTGISTTTTTKRRPSSTASPSTPAFPSPGSSGRASTPPPNGMSTTCREYASMDEATQLGMVELGGLVHRRVLPAGGRHPVGRRRACPAAAAR